MQKNTEISITCSALSKRQKVCVQITIQDFQGFAMK